MNILSELHSAACPLTFDVICSWDEGREKKGGNRNDVMTYLEVVLSTYIGASVPE